MGEKTKKKNVTFSLPVELVDRFREYARCNNISSLNEGVKEALTDYSIKIEKEKLYQAMKEASADPQFINEIEDTAEAFKDADQETAEIIPEW